MTEAPVASVPWLGATRQTRRADIHRQGKRTRCCRGDSPGGLVTRLMDETTIREEGTAHPSGRRALCPTLRPRTVRQHWLKVFLARMRAILAGLAPRGEPRQR